jgi:peptide-methionine (S)-S-oxide reductase
MTRRDILTPLALLAVAVGCQQRASSPIAATKKAVNDITKESESIIMAADARPTSSNAKLEKATFGSGCFWCTEAVFQNLRGVESVVSGYSNGDVENPTYEDVCTGRTGYAEVIQVTYDPAVIKFEDLLKVFWQTHDPTTPNQQGHDVGTQYRSGVFYHTDDQRKIAEQYKQQLDASKTFTRPIVTEITAIKNFYPAEKYHQNYFNANPAQSYCQFVIRPKVEKFNKEFKALLKDPASESK